MKDQKKCTFKLLSLIVIMAITSPLLAEETTAVPPPVIAPAPTAEVKPVTYNDLLQKKYSLSDEQMRVLTTSNLSDPQLAKVAQLAKSSNTSIDSVLKMRFEQKMGWGKIAKTLGVHPGELGRAASELRHEKNESGRENRDLKKKDHGTNRAHGKKG